MAEERDTSGCVREVDPLTTPRAASWQLFRHAPMPMVTIFQTWDITGLLPIQEKYGWGLNLLLCWCIGQAARQTEEFHLLPVGEKLLEYRKVGVSVIVAVRNGGICSCDLPLSDDLPTFAETYQTLTQAAAETGQDHTLADHMMVGTSSLVRYELDGVMNFYSGVYNNPMFFWGKYRREGECVKLPVSFQFHHVQMDGLEACAFLQRVQETIRTLADS